MLLLLGQAAQAQPAADSLYRQTLGFHQRLYNGPEYIRTYLNMSGHPFLEQDSMALDTIWYDHSRYDGVPLNYDIVRQQVITRGAQIFSISLVPEKIEAFSLNGRYFRRLDTVVDNRRLTGMYEVLHAGESLVLAYRYKEAKAASGSDEQGRFIPHRRFYVVRNGRVFTVEKANQLYQVFADRREQVKELLQQSPDFKTKPESILIATARLSETK
ncbi:hypothetical protein [Cnuella takakiae]|nr:hypothetical protein [Cnuella takakiae]